MAVDYLFLFGSGNPATKASLSPTFISFVTNAGQTLTPPAVTEKYPGTGFYTASYGNTVPVFFTLDGATTGLLTSERYIAGMMHPYDQFGQTLSAIAATLVGNGVLLANQGSTLTGIGNTVSSINVAGLGSTLSGVGNTLSGMAAFLGTTASSFGFTNVDPSTVFGFLKRAQEMNEGNRAYGKATGVLDYFSRGSSTLLIEKTITDSTTGTTCI